MWVDVVNVGDGACTVLRNGQESMVMDCGSWRERDGKLPGKLLRAALGAVASLPETIIVTHFDQDHWKGLEAFVSDSQQEPRKRIDLIYPRFPDLAKPVKAAHLAYQFLALATPEQSAFDLFTALESKASPVRNAGFAGQKFSAVGTVWEILWPPSELPSSVSKVFADAATDTEWLASQYPPLRKALDWAYKSSWMLSDEDAGPAFERTEEAVDEEDSPSGLELDELPKDELADWFDERTEVAADETHNPLNDSIIDPETFMNDDFVDAPSGIRGKLISNRRKVQQLNNELSLVVREENMQFLSLGDLQKWGLNELLRRGWLKRGLGEDSGYEVVLAPHHGTQAPGSTFIGTFPKSWLMVAQNGPEHLKRLKRHDYLSAKQKDLDSRIIQKIVSTAEVGTVSLCVCCIPSGTPYSWAAAWHGIL